MANVTAQMHALGADLVTAQQRALGLLDADLMNQATVLAYNHIFFLVAVLFEIVLPIVLLLGRAEHRVEDVEVLMD
jgi:hypothetical protein